MPLLFISPDEIVDLIEKKTSSTAVFKSISANANTFRIVLKIDKVPLDIKLNIQFDTFMQGMAYLNYSSTIPAMFVNMFKNYISEKTHGNIQIVKNQINININELISSYNDDIDIKSLKFDNGVYQIEFSMC